MQHAHRDSTPIPAPTRAELKTLIAAAAFDAGRDCEHCDGTGRTGGGRRLIHSIGPAGFGADWTAEGLLHAIDHAAYVHWSPTVSGHDLVVEVSGKPYQFQVQRPAEMTR